MKIGIFPITLWMLLNTFLFGSKFEQTMILRIYTIIFFSAMLFPQWALSQDNASEEHVYLAQGDVYTATVASNFAPVAHPEVNCQINGNITEVSAGLYQLNLTSTTNNFIGTTAVNIEYYELTPPFFIKPRYKRIVLHFSVSLITAQNDFAEFAENPIQILPLVNDSTTADSLWIASIGYCKSGTATISGDTITYNSNGQSDDDVIIYTIADSDGNSSKATIYLNRSISLSQSDTLRFYMENAKDVMFSIPSDAYTLDASPQLGSLEQNSELKFTYRPNANSGLDTIRFATSGGLQRTVIIEIFDIPNNASSIVDDVFYTGKNTPITFDVFANDLSSKYNIASFSSPLQYDTLGIFSYTPPANFTGTKNFTYTVNYGYYSATGKIAIHIGNFNPRKEVVYRLETKKNIATTLTYDVPVEGYSFALTAAPTFGVVEILQNMQDYTLDCNTISSAALISYTPDSGYYGNDEFDVEYCVNNNPCETYKIYVEVHDVVDSTCLCQGPDCVWSGDMNNDGIVSVRDLLVLGRNFGYSGSASETPDLPFTTGRASDDWLPESTATSNMKYVDGDGNGVVNHADLSTIIDNYGNVHNLVPNEVLAIKDFPFYMTSNAATVDSGDLLTIQYHIGTPSSLVKNFYGMAFEIKLASNFVDSASFQSHFYDNAWFHNHDASLQLAVQPTDGTIHMGVTRIDGREVSGFGDVGESSYIVEDELDGIKTSEDYIMRRIYATNIVIMDISGETVQLPDTYIDIKLNLKKSEPDPTVEKLLVFPNPTSGDIQLHFNGKNIIKGYRLFDLQGRVALAESNIDAQKHTILGDNLGSGMYILQTFTTLGTIQKKIEIIK